MSMILGCIADDFTGATDLAGTLVRAGMRAVQMIGVPWTVTLDDPPLALALKSSNFGSPDFFHKAFEAPP